MTSTAFVGQMLERDAIDKNQFVSVRTFFSSRLQRDVRDLNVSSHRLEGFHTEANVSAKIVVSYFPPNLLLE